MLLKIFLASYLTLNFANSQSTPVADSSKEPSSSDYTIDKNTPATSATGQTRNENERFPGENTSPLYITNNWTYQPYIEYSNVSPHSKSITQIAFGKSAVDALQKSKEPQSHHANILYLQPEIDKPIDNNQLIPLQSGQPPNILYLQPAQPQQQNVVYLPPQNSHDIYAPQQPETAIHEPQQPNIVYYNQVPQQVPENVIYFTPQANDYNVQQQQEVQPNFYQVKHMYLVTHVPSQKTAKDNKEALEAGTNQQSTEDSKKKGKDNENRDDKEKKHEKDHDEDDEHMLVETKTAKAIIEEYEKHYVKKHVGVDVKTDGESGTTQNPYPSATTPMSVTKSPAAVAVAAAPLSKQPIIVPDLDENNLEYDVLDKVYSTTQSTIKTVKTSATIYRATQPAIVVTPRPLATTFLAPITAGVQLQSVEAPKSVASPTPLPARDSVVVEIQKSVPYYLGKFEFVQNELPQQALPPSKSDEIQQNVDLGASLLKYSIERLPSAQALISELNHSSHIVQRTPQDQATYQQVLVQNAPSPSHLEKNQAYEAVRPLLVPSLPQESSPHLQQIISVPIKTVADYVQYQPADLPSPKQYLQIPPIVQPKPSGSVLIEPFPAVTKLLPQYVPLMMHQDVQKTPMKSYSYAPSYHQNNPQFIQHNYQITHSHSKKIKNLPVPVGGNYAPVQIVPQKFHHSSRLNDYVAFKTPVAPGGSGRPPFKASQQLQTVQEHLPPTQLNQQLIRKYRNPRHSFQSNIRLEYGFMPPLIPSIEIDENGKPITKNEE